MNANEPVAWMQTWENQDGELKRTVNIEQIGKQDIPLYTHPVKELTDEEILEAQKLFSNMHKNATESWGSLDLNNQSNLECARAWFIEGFAHGQKLKELTDEEITAISKEIFKDYKNFHHYQIDFARAVIKEVSGK